MSFKCKFIGHDLVPIDVEQNIAKCRRCGEKYIFAYNSVHGTMTEVEKYDPNKNYRKKKRW